MQPERGHPRKGQGDRGRRMKVASLKSNWLPWRLRLVTGVRASRQTSSGIDVLVEYHAATLPPT
jgi:hypothetical protein